METITPKDLKDNLDELHFLMRGEITKQNFILGNIHNLAYSFVNKDTLVGIDRAKQLEDELAAVFSLLINTNFKLQDYSDKVNRNLKKQLVLENTEEAKQHTAYRATKFELTQLN